MNKQMIRFDRQLKIVPMPEADREKNHNADYMLVEKVSVRGPVVGIVEADEFVNVIEGGMGTHKIVQLEQGHEGIPVDAKIFVHAMKPLRLPRVKVFR